MPAPRLLTVAAGLLALLCSCVHGESSSVRPRSRSAIDVDDPAALEEYTLALRQKHFSQTASCPPQLTLNNWSGRFDVTFRGFSLTSRDTCTGNQDNHCFPDQNSFCSDCGLCCTQSAGPWCCITNGGTVERICCPADTGLANGQQGCCYDWQTCDSVTGCTDPSTTTTTTIISWSTIYTTSTTISTQYTTSTSVATLYSTEYTTIPNAQTATDVIYTTLSSAGRRRTVGEASTHPTSSNEAPQSGLVANPTNNVQTPVVTLLAYAAFDPVARDLESMGVIVKRQTTITTTSTVSTSSTTTLQSVETSTLMSTIYETSTTSLVTTSTVFKDAQTTVKVTSTVTPTSSAGRITTSNTSTASTTVTAAGGGETSSASTSGGGGLSTGAKAGIGIGAVAGVAIILIALFLLWRRRRRQSPEESKDVKPPMAAVDNPKSSSERKHELQGAALMPDRNSRTHEFAGSSPSTALGGSLPPYRHGYEPVGTEEHPAEAPAHEQPQNQPYPQARSPNHFQYAPYELYDDRPHELYNSQYERGLRVSEIE